MCSRRCLSDLTMPLTHKLYWTKEPDPEFTGTKQISKLGRTRTSWTSGVALYPEVSISSPTKKVEEHWGTVYCKHDRANLNLVSKPMRQVRAFIFQKHPMDTKECTQVREPVTKANSFINQIGNKLSVRMGPMILSKTYISLKVLFPVLMGRQLVNIGKKWFLPFQHQRINSVPDTDSSALPFSSFLTPWLDFFVLKKFTVLKYNMRHDILHPHKLPGAIKN